MDDRYDPLRLARALDNNDLNCVNNILQRDAQMMDSSTFQNLAAQTNSYRHNPNSDYLVGGTDQNGLPSIQVFNQEGGIDLQVSSNQPPEQPQGYYNPYNPSPDAPPPGYYNQQPPPQDYYQRPEAPPPGYYRGGEAPGGNGFVPGMIIGGVIGSLLTDGRRRGY